MELSSAALWLDTIYGGYDSAILGFMHKLAELAGVVMTPVAKLITLLGEKGLIFFLLALVFLCFSRTRPLGVCLFGAVCCGALITNVILKDMVARPRPFEASEQFRQWWVYVGSPAEDGFSFPSGHVTAAAAGMTALSLMKGKKLVLPSVIIVVLMAVSRNYLMAHYPTDVMAAALIGLFSGFVAWLITHYLFEFLEDRSDVPVIGQILDFDLTQVLPDIRGLGSRAKVGRGKAIPQEDAAPSRRKETDTEDAPSRSGARYSSDAPSRRSGTGYRGKHFK